MDLYTALVSGLTNQQLANDPGGTRWARLVDRTVDMFIAAVMPAADRTEERKAMMQTTTDEIATDVFRLSTFIPDANIMFNQFLVRARGAAVVPHRSARALSARVRGGRRESSPSTGCVGSPSVTSKPTSAAR